MERRAEEHLEGATGRPLAGEGPTRATGENAAHLVPPRMSIAVARASVLYRGDCVPDVRGDDAWRGSTAIALALALIRRRMACPELTCIANLALALGDRS